VSRTDTDNSNDTDAVTGYIGTISTDTYANTDTVSQYADTNAADNISGDRVRRGIASFRKLWRAGDWMRRIDLR
jgi:hypothetical protein